MIEELHKESAYPVSESAGHGHAFAEVVGSKAEQLHLFLIVDMVRIEEIKECKCEQKCCR